MLPMLIASDLHGSLRAASHLIQEYKRHHSQSILFLGDYFSYEADIAQSGEHASALAQLLQESGMRISALQGNTDSQHQLALFHFLVEEYKIFLWQGLYIFASHGHRYDEYNPPPIPSLDILLGGHTHVPLLRRHQGYVYLNPGSVALPRLGSRHSYLLLKDSGFYWFDLDTGECYQQALFQDGMLGDLGPGFSS